MVEATGRTAWRRGGKRLGYEPVKGMFELVAAPFARWNRLGRPWENWLKSLTVFDGGKGSFAGRGLWLFV